MRKNCVRRSTQKRDRQHKGRDDQQTKDLALAVLTKEFHFA
jgi:hypothetical protein